MPTANKRFTLNIPAEMFLDDLISMIHCMASEINDIKVQHLEIPFFLYKHSDANLFIISNNSPSIHTYMFPIKFI